MVREREIRATALNVEALTQAVGGNRRALNVPTRPARTKRSLPAWLPRASGTPHQRVQRVLLARAIRVATALREELRHLLCRVIGLVTEVLGGTLAEVHIRVLVIGELVGRAIFQQLLDHFHDLAYGLNGADVVARWNHRQVFHIGAE